MQKKSIITIISCFFFLACYGFIVFFVQNKKGNNCVEFWQDFQLYPYPLSISGVKVQPGPDCKILLKEAYPEAWGLRTVKEIAKRSKAVAAINGGFFFEGALAGVPVHVFKTGDNWLSDPFKSRAAIGWKENGRKAMVGRLGMQWELEIGGEYYPINRINKPRNYKNAILYTSVFNDSMPHPVPGWDIVINHGKVEYITRSHKTGPSIPKEGFLYSVGIDSGIDVSSIQEGEEVQIHHRFIPKDLENNQVKDVNGWDDMEFILGGTPVLVSEGKIPSNLYIDHNTHDFIEHPHARTAVGLLEGGEWLFVVVDGANPFGSFGLTIPQLAQYMLSLGCKNAINLDGGSSSTLYYDGKVRNFPVNFRRSEGSSHEPLVGDAIVVTR